MVLFLAGAIELVGGTVVDDSIVADFVLFEVGFEALCASGKHGGQKDGDDCFGICQETGLGQ